MEMPQRLNKWPAAARVTTTTQEEKSMRRRFLGYVLGIMVAVAAGTSTAQRYPDKPVRMLVGFAPGGGTDATARAISQKLSERLGQQVIVDNRPGAAGNIATELAARANPDGYTILLGSIAALAVNSSLSRNPRFDPLKDLSAVTRAVDLTNVLVVHPSVSARSVKELVALARAKSLTGGSSGIGGAGHLALELFNLTAGTRIVHVPYKGGGPAMIDLLGGNINLIFASAASSVAYIKSGRIRAIAVTTLKRSALLPDLPTIAEAAFPGFDANNWYGFVAPARTPGSIINLLNKEIIAVMTTPEVKEFLF
ncbi:MAG TPA: tripartite tricarboxylate transporter substrate binding protein, partial [Bryobacteraceae bacterium]|nr:tripartite tricarboxylate transporter substrate binding protein [Bryobacteraceae bacterium]